MTSGDDPSSTGNTTVVIGDGNYTYSSNVTIWGPLPDDTRRSLQPDIIICAAVTWLIGLTLVVLRLYTRTRVISILGPSDWCIILSVLSAGGVTASQIEQAFHGAGKHSWQLDYEDIPAMTRASWYGILFYSLSLTFTKISILLLYRRIFNYGWIKLAIQIVLVAVLIIGCWLVATVSTACVPLQAYWDWSLLWTMQVYCQPINMWWANQGLHLATDFIIVLLPLPVLSTLTLPKKQKFAVMGVFTLGFFVCIVSIFRLVKLIEVENMSPIDASYSSASLSLWTIVEVNTAISCACVMTLNPLVVRFFPRFLAPSSHLSSPTPLGGTQMSRRGSRQSLARTNSLTGPWSPMSETRPRRTGLLPWMEESELDLADEGLKMDDVEGQRDRSLSSTVPESETCETDELTPLPRIHMRP